MASREGAEGFDERAVYVISVAAELAGMHPQTLRIYERKGLLQPARTPGNTRRWRGPYSCARVSRPWASASAPRNGPSIIGTA